MFSSPGPRVELLGNFLAKLAPGASEEGGGASVQVDQGDTPGAQDCRGLRGRGLFAASIPPRQVRKKEEK